MFVTERYTLMKVLNHLLENQYRLVYKSEERDEYILQKIEKKHNHIIRLMHRTYDWSNQMTRDVEQRISTILRQRQLLSGKNIHFHFVYISDLVPVDDWENLKKTRPIRHNKSVDLTVYYLDQESRGEEWERFSNQLEGLNSELLNQLPSTEEQERQSIYLEQKIHANLFKKQKEFERVFSFGKTRLTFLLLAINVFIFMLIENSGGSTNVQNLVDWGAKYNPYIADGEYWRIVTSMFLHIGILHLIMNMIALYYLGDLTEKIYGTKRFFFIYFLAGIFGSVASFATNDSVAAGASGAIFGLFGALLFFGLHYREIFFKTMGINLIIVIGINILFGLSVPQIDNGAHIGGLIGGFMASQVVHLPKKKSPIIQIITGVIILVTIVIMFTLGLGKVK
ncbi:rhomboid family intramembrane serine protease [Piscibacillus halophilus]|uniref:Rhomboid family peptidase. Serine peptidase. MEROPS family S54 n=2 Tax=Piscibacillus halophilus TaxID=571933 RepID=A0A1H9MC56_9BACI|nr:rhomboid family intramembrane serine protease [Piscibacillus halophilus]SER21212.1 rhomboid family peptidase. Serine peptidase. MEROPS family S54 [Piscibacillus halophilus]